MAGVGRTPEAPVLPNKGAAVADNVVAAHGDRHAGAFGPGGEAAQGVGRRRIKHVVVEKMVSKDKSNWDRWQRFTQKTFLNAGITGDGIPTAPTETLCELLECKNSGMAARILRAKVGSAGRDF